MTAARSRSLVSEAVGPVVVSAASTMTQPSRAREGAVESGKCRRDLGKLDRTLAGAALLFGGLAATC